MKKIFLDAGHGGKDSGALGNGLKEKDIALSVTLKIGKILERHKVEVLYSRTRDEFIELRERANKANRENVHIFVSVHTNAFTNSSASGVETYSYPGSLNGAKLSKSIYESIVEDKVYTLKRGTKTANFSVLKNTNMPSVLVELGFITNKDDAEILKNKQDELATAISKGILKYLGLGYIEKEKEIVHEIYKVQLGAFKDRKNAEKLVKELKNKGYEAFIV